MKYRLFLFVAFVFTICVYSSSLTAQSSSVVVYRDNFNRDLLGPDWRIQQGGVDSGVGIRNNKLNLWEANEFLVVRNDKVPRSDPNKNWSMNFEVLFDTTGNDFKQFKYMVWGTPVGGNSTGQLSLTIYNYNGSNNENVLRLSGGGSWVDVVYPEDIFNSGKTYKVELSRINDVGYTAFVWEKGTPKPASPTVDHTNPPNPSLDVVVDRLELTFVDYFTTTKSNCYLDNLLYTTWQ